MHRIRPALHARRILITCLLAFGVAGGVAGTALLVRWQTDRATPDVRLFLDRDLHQVQYALHNWKKSSLLLRDALDKVPRAEPDRAQLASSAVEYTPSLIGTGWIDSEYSIHWWAPPAFFSETEREQLSQQLRRKGRFRHFLGLGTIQTFIPQSGRAFLVIREPLRGLENRTRRLLTVFDLTPFFAQTLGSSGVRVLEGKKVLFGPPETEAVTAEATFSREGVRWTVQRQREFPTAVPVGWLHLLLAVAVMLFLAALLGIVWAVERLRQFATTDFLTGLYNRRFFMERLEEEAQRANRYLRPMSCLMIDLDGFKQINDLQGHWAGDELLHQVAQELRNSLRRSDILARFGGDEFVAILPETGREQASEVVKKLRRVSSSGVFAPVQLSVGMAVLRIGEDSPQDLIERADENLYATRTSARHGWNQELPPLSQPQTQDPSTEQPQIRSKDIA